MRRAFTVVELLVVIAIIGVLVALIVPAVQFAREAARKTTCASNLKQIAMAAIQHNTTFEYFPNAGGIDGAARSLNADGIPYNALRQDWGIFYQVLPYIEQKNAYDLVNPAEVAGQKVKIYFCPTRRPPTAVQGGTTNGLQRTDWRGGVDYAGNGGEIVTINGQPATYVPAPSAQYNSSLSQQVGVIIPRPNAIVGSRSEKITGSSISDGLSNVIMFGERQYNRKPPVAQLDEDNGYINGWSYDTIRWGFGGRPAPDRTGTPSSSTRFGGPHSGVVMMAFCDGSVRPLAYSGFVGHMWKGTAYSPDETFRQLCNRRDGIIPPYIQN